MPEDPVIKIIEMAFADNVLRCRLISDMSGALKRLGTELTFEQIEQLAQALNEGGDIFASGLDKRLSQSGVSLTPQALLRQGKKKTAGKRDAVKLRLAGDVFEQTAGFKNTSKGTQPESHREDASASSECIIDSDEPDYEVERD